MFARSVARPLLASMFVTGGFDSLMRPTPKVPAAEPVVDLIVDAAVPATRVVAERVEPAVETVADGIGEAVTDTAIEDQPVVAAATGAAQHLEEQVHQVGQGAPLPFETETWIRVNGAVQVAGGLLLATGRLPRLAAGVLALTLVPTTLAGHRFWEAEGDQRAAQRVHFTKNLGLLGGLLLAAVDTGGRPSLAWRATHRRSAHRQLPALPSLPHLTS